MKSLVLYPYPMEFDGVSIQGELLFRGIVENKDQAAPCGRDATLEKEWRYNTYKPDVVLGVGFWGDFPEIVMHPQKHGMLAVPWLNADGWVSNYVNELNELPLILTTSHWVKDTYNRDGVDNKNIYPMPIGIDTDEMSPLPKDDKSVKKIREMLGVKEDEKMILTIGGDTTSKGFQEVLRALGSIDKEFEKWKYIGKSWYCPYYHRRDELEIMKELGIKRNKVKFVDGAMSRAMVRALLSACDVYAGPSRIEGFGMIQVEAQSCGKPVIGINAMGLNDTIVDKKTGFLPRVAEEIKLDEEWVYKSDGFPKKMKIKFDKPKTFAYRADIGDIAEGILKLCTDDSLREKMSVNAREHAVKKFNYVKTSKDVSDLIKKKIGIE